MSRHLSLLLGGPRLGVQPGRRPPPLQLPAGLRRRETYEIQGSWLEALQAGVASGQVNAATLVWSAGMAEWKQASQVEALAPLFATPPSPPPPTPSA